jgi:hypothetical protein
LLGECSKAEGERAGDIAQPLEGSGDELIAARRAYHRGSIVMNDVHPTALFNVPLRDG